MNDSEKDLEDNNVTAFHRKGENWVKYVSNKERLTKHEIRKDSIRIEEVSQHNTEDDCWMVWNSKVYDVTPFIEYHPGGRKVLESFWGSDATKGSNDCHHYVDWEKYLRKVYIGNLKKKNNCIIL